MKRQPETIEVNFRGYNLEVTGIYTPGEEPVLFPIDNAHPGSSEKFDIKSVRMVGEESEVPADVKEEELEEYILENKLI